MKKKSLGLSVPEHGGLGRDFQHRVSGLRLGEPWAKRRILASRKAVLLTEGPGEPACGVLGSHK